jgi:periplasmic protein TonB
MKKILLFPVLLAMSVLVFGQGNFKVVKQQQAHYPGGDTALQVYFNKHVHYSQDAYDHRAYGYVQLSFDVNADSTLSDIVILKGMDYGISEEVLRIFRPIKFAPAVSNNVAYRSNVIVSVNVKAIK